MTQGQRVAALSVDYGQLHRKELHSALAVKSFADEKKLSMSLNVIDLSSLRDVMAGSSQTDDAVPVPEGHYAAENMKTTVVPNRNMILLSVAAALAISTKAYRIAYAAHAGDHAIYPDCRPEFMFALQSALNECDYQDIWLDAPFKHWTKAAIVKVASDLGAPLHLTWSCYKGAENHCGKCGTCVERKEAFDIASVTDPTFYEAA